MTETGRINEETVNQPATTDKVEVDFNLFIDNFSKGTAFQRSRTLFPLKIKQYDLENDKDTILYKHRSDFEMMDFRKNKSVSNSDKWTQKIILDKSQKAVVIQIRGIDNGIIVDYLFEKRNGKWLFVAVEDSST
ncbi:DUF4348 domain-containing protein [Lacibacter sp. H407]|uniref:DUF4348 domain-containing protein n=1 Tax=Lacibacter sp. H407 TaxID=3133423 RepID=UPI0030BE2545